MQNAIATEKIQVVGRSAAGGRYRYDRGVSIKTMRLSWNELRDAEKVALDGFFTTTVDGVMTQFTYTDHRGTAWDAYFADPVLEFTEVADKQSGAKTTFTSGAVSYPTTTRTAGVWACQVTLEVSVPA